LPVLRRTRTAWPPPHQRQDPRFVQNWTTRPLHVALRQHSLTARCGSAQPLPSQMARPVLWAVARKRTDRSRSHHPTNRMVPVVWHNPSSFTVTDENRLAAASPAPGSAAEDKSTATAALLCLTSLQPDGGRSRVAPLVEVPPVGPRAYRNAGNQVSVA
jgi:hypothetical protein